MNKCIILSSRVNLSKVFDKYILIYYILISSQIFFEKWVVHWDITQWKTQSIFDI